MAPAAGLRLFPPAWEPVAGEGSPIEAIVHGNEKEIRIAQPPRLTNPFPYSHRRGGGSEFCGSEFGGTARPSSPLNA
jgi:hypothetical protein